MGELETKLKKEIRKGKIQKITLECIKAAGVLSIALVAPKCLKILNELDKDYRRKQNPKYLVNRSFYRLLDQGLIKLEQTSEGKFVRLTAAGEKTLEQIEKYNYKIKKPKKWDGKWRIILFDIKEKRRGIRDLLRKTLNNLGFVRLQHSAWVYPYDCEDLIILLKADFKMGKEILYVIADKIENDAWLRDDFGLN